jgi:hypothetical protein
MRLLLEKRHKAIFLHSEVGCPKFCGRAVGDIRRVVRLTQRRALGSKTLVFGNVENNFLSKFKNCDFINLKADSFKAVVKFTNACYKLKPPDVNISSSCQFDSCVIASDTIPDLTF